MIEYYEYFGDKFCCVEDLTIYTDLLSEQEGQQVKVFTPNCVRILGSGIMS